MLGREKLWSPVCSASSLGQSQGQVCSSAQPWHPGFPPNFHPRHCPPIQTRGNFIHLVFFITSAHPRHHWRGIIGLTGLCWGIAPWRHWLQGVCHLHELQGFVTSRGSRGLLSPGTASLSQILIFQPSKFPFSFLFLGFCHVFLQSAQICSYFQSI